MARTETLIIQLPIVGEARMVAGVGWETKDRETCEIVGTPETLAKVLFNRYSVKEVGKEPPFLVLETTPLKYEPDFAVMTDIPGDPFGGVNIGQEYNQRMLELVNQAHTVAGSERLAEYWRQKGGLVNLSRATAYQTKATLARKAMTIAGFEMDNIAKRAFHENKAIPTRVYRALEYARENMVAAGQVDTEALEDLLEEEMANWFRSQPKNLISGKDAELSRKDQLQFIKTLSLLDFNTLAFNSIQLLSAIPKAMDQVMSNRWVHVLGIGGLGMMVACSAETPTNVAVMPTETTKVLPTDTAEQNLPGGPDEPTQQQVPPTPVSIEQVATVEPVNSTFEIDAAEVQRNVKAQYEAEAQRLRSLGYNIVNSEAALTNEKDVFLKGYQTVSGDYHWTIGGTTMNGFVYAVLSDGRMAYDPGLITADSSFIELVDGFGAGVDRNFEFINGKWRAVVRDQEGKRLAVNLDSQGFGLEKENAKQLLGFEADEVKLVGETMVYTLNGVPVVASGNGGEVTPMTNGFVKHEDGSFWGINTQTGKWEQAVFPQGIDPVLEIEQYTGPVENDQGKILGLNEFGWAVTEYKDGRWIPFERVIKIAGDDQAMPVDQSRISEEILKPLSVNEITPIMMRGLYDRSENPWGDYLGMQLPIEADGKLKTGYLGSWENYMKYFGGYVLGTIDPGFDYPGGLWLVIEIPFITERQIIAQYIPNQSNVINDVYLYRQINMDDETGNESLKLYREPMIYRDLVAKFKMTSNLRGYQVVFAKQTYNSGNNDITKRHEELFEALEKGKAIDSWYDWSVTHLWLPEEAAVWK